MISWPSRIAAPLILAGFVILTPGCGDRKPAAEPVEEQPAAIAEPTPGERLQNAVDVWSATSAFHFRLALENRVIPLDAGGLLTYTTAEGDVVTPDRMQAQTTVRTPVGNAQVAFISIGDRQWITNPLSRQWEAAPAGTAGAVASAFDSRTGIGATLSGLAELQYTPDERLDGTPVYRLSGILPGTVLAGFAADLSAVPTLQVDLFITPADNRIRRIVVRQPATPEGAVPSWTFDFSNFDVPVPIEPPL
ncbi:MAG: LppX_LprAFG lipoprotein [Gemmatimonadota bacterium]|nr:LppX_LprAFG lipoprotein [Gemmatimonadota bacterium]